MDPSSITGLFSSATSGNWCYSFNSCLFPYVPCEDSQVHNNVRYNDPSSVWVLICSIIVFFMKAGFMLVEVSYAKTVEEKRNVVVIKHQDAFASAFGFFLLGFDVISQYSSPQEIGIRFFGITDPILWFFKFTFASNAATIVGGCLVTNTYKLRLPAAFISAFVISGILHPIIARIIWSDDCSSLSPYRYCDFGDQQNSSVACGYNCTQQLGLTQRLYVLDFAGGGAVHLLGGVAGLVICLFAKLKEVRDPRTRPNVAGVDPDNKEREEGFWKWMYPEGGGEELVSDAALGVIILWFCWFAFNCGSTESVESARQIYNHTRSEAIPYHAVPSIIAINMIMAVAAGGTTAVIIAMWARVRTRTRSLNANEIANGILSSLVAITAGCAFVDYWGACLIGIFAVIFYHGGCFLEYKLDIKDTARVVPVHGVCGLWSLIGTALFLVGDTAECNLHAAFEGLCYCQLRLPHLNYGERILAQLIGGGVMIGIAAVGSFLMYGLLYIIPVQPFVWVFERVFFLRYNDNLPRCLKCLKCLYPSPPKHNEVYYELIYKGGWLLTSPHDEVEKISQNVSSTPEPNVSPTLEPEGEDIDASAGLLHNPVPKAGSSTPPSHLGTYQNGSNDPGSQRYGATGFTPTATYHTAKETISNKGRKRGKVIKVDVHLEDGEDGL